MAIKIPQLKSKYIPVHSSGSINEIHWWRDDSFFQYPNILLNLITTNKDVVDKVKKECGDIFLLTDSGGFQVGAGMCDLDWESSILRQIELGASKIFSFDTPVIKERDSSQLHSFQLLNLDEAKKVIKDNFDTGLKQSQYLKEKYPEEFTKFCYILQAKSIEQLNYNMELIDSIGGVDNYLNYFPGGIVYAMKGGDNLYITITARHAYENFIKKGIYVHFLGMGSTYRMMLLVRNEISTFDSSSALQGVRMNGFLNPFNTTQWKQIPSDDFLFEKQFCVCPTCINVNYQELLKTNPTMVGKHFITHNLWQTLSINVFLDSIPKNRYTEIVSDYFNLNEDMKQCLDFCDMCDKDGYKYAYDKYKHYLKKDETKQKGLF